MIMKQISEDKHSNPFYKVQKANEILIFDTKSNRSKNTFLIAATGFCAFPIAQPQQ